MIYLDISWPKFYYYSVVKTTMMKNHQDAVLHPCITFNTPKIIGHPPPLIGRQPLLSPSHSSVGAGARVRDQKLCGCSWFFWLRLWPPRLVVAFLDALSCLLQRCFCHACCPCKTFWSGLSKADLICRGVHGRSIHIFEWSIIQLYCGSFLSISGNSMMLSDVSAETDVGSGATGMAWGNSVQNPYEMSYPCYRPGEISTLWTLTGCQVL